LTIPGVLRLHAVQLCTNCLGVLTVSPDVNDALAVVAISESKFEADAAGRQAVRTYEALELQQLELLIRKALPKPRLAMDIHGLDSHNT
jgi:hypothetical protein